MTRRLHALVRQVETVDELAPDPRGEYIVGRTWLSFFAKHGHFSGTIVWGVPSADDIASWEAAAALRLSPACEPHASLFDAHKVEELTPTAFGALAKYAAKNVTALSERITRLGIVHSGSFAGAVAAGFAKLVRVPVPFEVFATVDEALEWLGRSEDAPILAELARIHDEARQVPPILRRLASHLARHPSTTPAQAARALGLSTRSFQRRLADEGTTFRRQLDTARVRLAQRLLRDSEASVTEIALQVGLTSPQHLSTLFRRLGHETPSAWRARSRTER